MEKSKISNYREALEDMITNAKAKFDESVEVHARLRIDSKKSDQQVRGSVELPHGSGKVMHICVITSVSSKEAKDAGADEVGDEQLIEKIKTSGKANWDVVVATTEMMPKLAVVAKILGPKGLMPNPKNKTVTSNISEAVKSIKKGRINFKNDNSGNVHISIGKVSFGVDKLSENFLAFIEALKKSKPESVKGKFIHSIHLCSTMGKSYPIEVKM